MNERELTLFSALSEIGDDLVLESGAFLPGGEGVAVARGRRAPWFIPATLASCAALIAAVGICVYAVGNGLGIFPSKPPDVTTEEVTAEETVEESTEEDTHTITEEMTEEDTEAVTDAETEEETTDSIGEEEVYRVSFVIIGADSYSQPSLQTVKEGQCAVEPVLNLPDDGSHIKGWYTTAACAEADRFDFSTPITSDLTLYARIEGRMTEAPTDPPEEPTDEPTDEPTEPMPETVREALTTHTDILQSTMVSWQRSLENVTVERVMGAIARIEAASSYFGATNEGGYYLEARDGKVYLCRKIVYPIQGLEEEGSQILSEYLGEKS